MNHFFLYLALYVYRLARQAESTTKSLSLINWISSYTFLKHYGHLRSIEKNMILNLGCYWDFILNTKLILFEW